MATSVVPDLLQALVTRLPPALSGINVYDVYGTSDDPGDYLMIGVEDPDDDRAVSAESKQDWHGLGAKARLEEGSVTCVAVSWNGDSDVAAARAACKATTDAVENHLRSDPNLGGTVPGLMWVGYGERTKYDQLMGTSGAAVICTFDVAFKARI